MLHQRLTTLALLAGILVSAGGALAQQNNSPKENSSSDNALREKAFDLLKDLAGQIHILQSPENRARMGSNIAESLWDHDGNKARGLFISVQDEIKTVLQSVADDEVEEQTRLVFLHLRADTVERIAKHDPEFALAFWKTTEPVQRPDRPHESGDADRVMEMRLAKAVAANSPELALKLGRQTLARGFSEDLLTLLRLLIRKHPEQGQVLYKEIVAKLRDTDPARYSDAFYVAHKLALLFAPPAVSDSAFQELISMLITSALANGCGVKTSEAHEKAWYCTQIGALISRMERVDPVRAARLKQWAASGPEEPEWSLDAYDELNEVNSSGKVDDMIALAGKYPQRQYDIYTRAVRMAEASGDYTRARQIANDYLADPAGRQFVLAQIDRDEKWASIDDARVAELQQMANSMPQARDRLRLLLFTAGRINGNRRTVMKLLNDASAIVETMKPGKEQTEAQFGLAVMYCAQDSDRGLAIIESMMPKLNELISASAKLDGYENRYLRDGEWNMTAAGAVGDLLTKLSQNAGYFAWSDFDRALSVSAQFERPELRLMAQLKLAQAILAGRPKRAPMFGGYVTY